LQNNSGETPVLVARRKGHEDLARLLEEHARIQLEANQQMRG
jgi:hypothetical protein